MIFNVFEQLLKPIHSTHHASAHLAGQVPVSRPSAHCSSTLAQTGTPRPRVQPQQHPRALAHLPYSGCGHTCEGRNAQAQVPPAPFYQAEKPQASQVLVAAGGDTSACHFLSKNSFHQQVTTERVSLC